MDVVLGWVLWVVDEDLALCGLIIDHYSLNVQSSPDEHVVDLKSVHFAPGKHALPARWRIVRIGLDNACCYETNVCDQWLDSSQYPTTVQIRSAQLMASDFLGDHMMTALLSVQSARINCPNNVCPANGARHPLRPYDDVQSGDPDSSYQPHEYPS